MSEIHRSSFTPCLIYKDNKRAIDWLQKAFGFELALLVTDAEGKIGHCEMRFGDSTVFVGDEWHADAKSPASIGGKNTQNVHVQLKDGIDAHCERARAAGAVIAQEPVDQFYGDRTYRARDHEGHLWTFGQSVRNVSLADMSRASGFDVKAFP